MLFLILITALILVLGYFINKRYEHPAVIFSATWLFISVLYEMQLFDINDLTDQQWLIMLIMVVAFPVGCLLYEILLRDNREDNISLACNSRQDSPESEDAWSVYENSSQLRESLFWFFCAITIIILLVDEMQIIRSLLGGSSFHDIMREANGKQTVEYSGVLQVSLYMFIVHPMSVCSIPICAVEFFRREEKRWRYLIVNLIIVALSVVHHGGRNSIIVFAVCYLLAFTLIGKKFEISNRVKKIFAALLFVLACLVIRITASRGIEDTWLSFYAYFICCIPLSQSYLSYSFVSSHNTWGFFSLKGFFYPFFTVLNKIGISSPKSYSDAVTIANIMEDNYLKIGDYSSTGTNAFIPAGTYMYIDGGYLFEVLGMLLYGFICSYVYHLQKKTGEEKHLALYILLAYGLVLSFTRLYFTSYHYFLSMIYILFLFYGNSKSKKRIRFKIGG